MLSRDLFDLAAMFKEDGCDLVFEPFGVRAIRLLLKDAAERAQQLERHVIPDAAKLTDQEITDAGAISLDAARDQQKGQGNG